MRDQTCPDEDDVLAGGFSWRQLRCHLMQLEGNTQAIRQAKRLLFANRELLLREPNIRLVRDELEATWRCGDHRLRVRFDSKGDVTFQCWPPEWLLSQVLEGLADTVIHRAAAEIRRSRIAEPDEVEQPTEPSARRETKPRVIPTVECRCESCGRAFPRSVHQDQRNSQRGYHTFCSHTCSARYRRSDDGDSGD